MDSRLGEIRADERKVRQVVLNLLSNAIKFTPEGGRIEVGAALKDKSVEVSVSDTGVGSALPHSPPFRPPVQLAESYLTGALFPQMLQRTARLGCHAT